MSKGKIPASIQLADLEGFGKAESAEVVARLEKRVKLE